MDKWKGFFNDDENDSEDDDDGIPDVFEVKESEIGGHGHLCLRTCLSDSIRVHGHHKILNQGHGRGHRD